MFVRVLLANCVSGYVRDVLTSADRSSKSFKTLLKSNEKIKTQCFVTVVPDLRLKMQTQVKGCVQYTYNESLS